jgi:hypothetical protein
MSSKRTLDVAAFRTSASPPDPDGAKIKTSDFPDDMTVMEVQRSPDGLGMDAETRINVGSELNGA